MIIVTVILYAIGAAWAFILHQEFAFTRRAWSIGFALIWPAMALLAVCGSAVRAVRHSRGGGGGGGRGTLQMAQIARS